MKHGISVTFVSLFFASIGCTADEIGRGDLRVLVEAEDVIIDGLDPGEGVENIQDGWAVRFDRYIVALGAVDVHLATDASVEAEADELHVIDLSAISAGGESLWSLAELEEGAGTSATRWSKQATPRCGTTA